MYFNYDGSCVSIELFAKDVTLICLNFEIHALSTGWPLSKQGGCFG